VSLEAMANQDQVDELLSLQAIYEGDEDVWLHWPEHLTQPPADSTCVGQHGLQLEVDVVIKMSEAVTQQNDTRASELQLLCLQQSDRSTTESSLTVQALPLKLSISLPTSYLDAHCAESVMPSIMVSASWLSTGTRENLESELERQGRESSQTQILFFWIEWLRHEACTFLTSVSTDALPTCETKCADNPNMSLLVSGNLLDLASWSQKKRRSLRTEKFTAAMQTLRRIDARKFMQVGHVQPCPLYHMHCSHFEDLQKKQINTLLSSNPMQYTNDV